LPLDQTFRWDVSGRTVVLTNRVVHLDHASVPPEALTIPPGAQLVESQRLRTARAGAVLDSLRPSAAPLPAARP
jgi:hypothetical protein